MFGAKQKKKEKNVRKEVVDMENESTNRFFAICDNCDSKIFKHQGYKEHPKGVFNIFVTCPHCDHQFTHKITSKKGKEKLMADKQTPVAKEVLKNLGMSHFFDKKSGNDK